MITVYKLGGSLLELPDLRTRLGDLLAQRPLSQPLIVVGGGEAAHLVRRWDAVHQLSDESGHWLAIAAMALNEQLLAALCPETMLIANREDAAAAWGANCIPVVNAAMFLRDEESRTNSADRLPCSWDVTSDSIAAWIARCWPAEELVLLKSCEPTGSDSAVDPLFRHIAGKAPRIGWANLRTENPMIQPWQPSVVRRL